MRNPVPTPTSPARAAGQGVRTPQPQTTTPQTERPESITAAEKLLQAQLEARLQGETDERTTLEESMKYYDAQIAAIEKQIADDAIPDDDMAIEWQTKIDALQSEIDAAPHPAAAASKRAEQRQWQRQLQARREGLRRPVNDKAAQFKRHRQRLAKTYTRRYDENGIRRVMTPGEGFVRGITNPRNLADSFVEGLLDTIIGLPVLALSSPQLVQELRAYSEFIGTDPLNDRDYQALVAAYGEDSPIVKTHLDKLYDQNPLRSHERAEIDAMIAAFGEDSLEVKQLLENQIATRTAWMRENAPNLLPIFEYYNESLVSAFNDPETFAKTLEERPFDVYVHVLDAIPVFGEVIGGALARGRIARGRTATGRLRADARVPGRGERVARGAARAAQYVNPEELPIEVGRNLLNQRGPQWQAHPVEPGVTPRRAQTRAAGAIPEYTGADPAANPFQAEVIPQAEMPMSTGGDPTRGDQAGCVRRLNSKSTEMRLKRIREDASWR